MTAWYMPITSMPGPPAPSGLNSESTVLPQAPSLGSRPEITPLSFSSLIFCVYRDVASCRVPGVVGVGVVLFTKLLPSLDVVMTV